MLFPVLPTIFAAAQAPDIRYQRVFFVAECPICLGALTADNTVETSCRHLFHQHCLDEALMRNNRCPSCRHNFAAPAVAHAEPAAPACCAADACPEALPVARDLVPHPINQEFVDAALRGNGARVHELLAAHTDVNSVDSNGRTALMQASQQGQIAIVRELLAAGADVNIVAGPRGMARNHGPFALMLATGNGNIDIIRLLIAAGANVNANNCGCTALMMATWMRNAGETAAPIILELLAAGAGATINTVDQNGRTALFIAAEMGDGAAVQALLAAGATVDRGKRTALWIAIEKGHEAVIQLLVGAGANVNAYGPDGKTALEITLQRRNGYMGNRVEYIKWSNIERLLKQAGAL
jgi:ankyrin repeat protein